MIALVRRNLTFFISKHSSPVSFSFSPLFYSTPRESELCISPAVFDLLRRKYDFPPDLAARVASKSTHSEKADSILSFFKENGFSNIQLFKILKCRHSLLSASLEGCIKPKFKLFQDLGFSAGEIRKIFSSNPTILELSANENIIPKLFALKGLLGSDNEVGRVIRKSPWFLTVNLGNNALPNVEFLKSCGVAMARILIILHSYPSSFLLKPELIRKSAQKAKEMGLNESSKNFIYAIPTIASMSDGAWELKLQAFRVLGFSESQILTIFRKQPPVFCGSVEKIKKITELLLATGKFNISSIIHCPKSLWYSVEKRYVPRLRILRILESKDLIKKWPSLTTMCQMSDDKFYEKFIKPYSNEVGTAYVAKI